MDSYAYRLARITHVDQNNAWYKILNPGDLIWIIPDSIIHFDNNAVSYFFKFCGFKSTMPYNLACPSPACMYSRDNDLQYVWV